jgi:hypothetical protein
VLLIVGLSSSSFFLPGTWWRCPPPALARRVGLIARYPRGRRQTGAETLTGHNDHGLPAAQ